MQDFISVSKMSTSKMTASKVKAIITAELVTEPGDQLHQARSQQKDAHQGRPFGEPKPVAVAAKTRPGTECGYPRRSMTMIAHFVGP